MSPQEIVKKVLDNQLLPKFPYDLIVIEVGDTWYVNVEILVDYYSVEFAPPIRKIITQGLEMLGDVAYLNNLKLKNHSQS